MVARTVRLGFLRYRGIDGNTHLGFIGEDIDVHEDDLERFDSLNPEPTIIDVVDAIASGEAFTQDDIDAAVEDAKAEKDAELEQARQAIEAEKAALEQAKAEARERIEAEANAVVEAKAELAREREAFEAEKAEKKPAPRAAAKQS